MQREFPASVLSREAGVWIPLLEKEVSAEHDGRLHLQRMEFFTRKGDYAAALRENGKLLTPPKSPFADAALLSMGLIFADPNNPARDHLKALGYFGELVRDFRQSPYAEEARIWCGILREEFTAEREACALLKRVRLLLQKGDFDGALRENQEVLAHSPKAQPADAALFGLALFYADRANPRQDYRKCIGFLAQLARDFPQSPLAEDAGIWQVLLREQLSAEHEGRAHLLRMELLMRRGEFEVALRENQKIIASPAKGQPVDAALFSLGLICADQSNPKKDFKKSLAYFARIRREYPGGPFAEEAKIWVGVLETMEKALRVDLEIEEKKNQLRR